MDYWIKNYSGTMYWKNVKLFEFSIVDRQLVHFKQFTDDHLIWTLVNREPGYWEINFFLMSRLKEENSMFIKEFLEAYYLDTYDAEEISKRANGNNRLDCYWVQYQNFGPQTWEELQEVREPYWKTGRLEDYYHPVYENIIYKGIIEE